MKYLVFSLICFLSVNGNNPLIGQDYHIDGDLYLGNFQLENPLPKLKITMDEGNTSGILIENKNGSAHTWLPYNNGSIYLTGDRTDGKTGNLVFRSFGDSGYKDIMTLYRATGSVRLNGYEAEFLGPIRQLLVQPDGKLKAKSASEVWSINAIAFYSTSDDFVMFPGFASIDEQNPLDIDVIRANVDLPNGVVMSHINVAVDDTYISHLAIIFVRRERVSGDTEWLALLKSTDINGSGVLNANLSQHSTIDNNLYEYYLDVLPEGGWSENIPGYRMSIRGAQIFYSYVE